MRLLAQEGLTPLDYLVGVMRGQFEYDEPRFEAAKAAAPYMHPKLVAAKVETKIELTLAELVEQSFNSSLRSDEDPAQH